MVFMELQKIRKYDYWLIERIVTDGELYALYKFLSDLGVMLSKEDLIADLKKKWICGGNASIIRYDDDDVHKIYILNVWNDKEPDAPTVKILDENLYEIIHKWHDLCEKEVDVITLSRDGNTYFIEGK